MPPKVRKQKKKINNGDTNLHHTTNISNQDKESNEILEKLKTMRVLDHTPKNITPNVRNVESLLSKRMKVYITDGRIIFGDFKCLDNEGNLILTGTSQFYYEPEEDPGRGISCILIPEKYITSIKVLLSKEESEGIKAM